MSDDRKYPPPICAWCGKFASPKTVAINYTPDTAFTAERVEYKCERCQKRDAERRRAAILAKSDELIR